MALPKTDASLDALYYEKRECEVKVGAAEARGDRKEARAIHMQIRKINSMIYSKGGNLNA